MKLQMATFEGHSASTSRYFGWGRYRASASWTAVTESAESPLWPWPALPPQPVRTRQGKRRLRRLHRRSPKPGGSLERPRYRGSASEGGSPKAVASQHPPASGCTASGIDTDDLLAKHRFRCVTEGIVRLANRLRSYNLSYETQGIDHHRRHHTVHRVRVSGVAAALRTSAATGADRTRSGDHREACRDCGDSAAAICQL